MSLRDIAATTCLKKSIIEASLGQVDLLLSMRTCRLLDHVVVYPEMTTD